MVTKRIIADAQLDEWIAIHVMEWHMFEDWWCSDHPRTDEGYEQWECLAELYCPTTDLNQAMGVLDEIDIWWLDKSTRGDTYRIQVGGEGGKSTVKHCDCFSKISRTICEAVYSVMEAE